MAPGHRSNASRSIQGYILTIEADDRLCAIAIVVPFAGLKTILDLAKLPCDR